MTKPHSRPPAESEAFPFTPVPVRTRHDGWTPARQRAFIAALAQFGVVAGAARHVGLSTKSAYALRTRAGAEGFAAAWAAAESEGRERARAVAIERAMDGVVTPIFYRGRQVGERRSFDNRLVLAALRLIMADRRDPRDADAKHRQR